jgi:hypothetical protein
MARRLPVSPSSSANLLTIGYTQDTFGLKYARNQSSLPASSKKHGILIVPNRIEHEAEQRR